MSSRMLDPVLEKYGKRKRASEGQREKGSYFVASNDFVPFLLETWIFDGKEWSGEEEVEKEESECMNN